MGLEIKNVSKRFGQAEVIKDVSFEVAAGGFASLSGKSGSGKSTLLYIISSLDNPTTGSVTIDGQRVDDMQSRDLHAFRNRHMGFIFQFHYLLPEFTALENVLMPALKAGETRTRRDYAVSLLEKFDLKDKLHSLPGQLSGGQSQRVAVARALVMEPRYIFADEPTGALDSTNARIIMDIFRSINTDLGTTVVFVTHDREFAQLARHRIELVDGRLVGDTGPGTR